MELNGCRALVTGGAVRIGAAITRCLAAEGCTVVIHCNRSWSAAEALAEDIRHAAGTAFVVGGDLADASECAAVVNEAHHLAGGLDILVNNAAVFHQHRFAEADRTALLSELDINAFAPIDLTRRFVALGGTGGRLSNAAPWLRGKIVNLLDRRIAGVELGSLPYQLSKHMLADFTRLAALELAPGFSVNAVAPGPVLGPPGTGAGYLKESAGEIPLACDCSPEAVAASVCFLLRQDAITGQVIFVDGGQHLLGNVLRRKPEADSHG
jgi:pteridine reductase